MMTSKVIAFILIVLILPLFLIISLMIYFADGLPISFKQRRIGLRNKEFLMVKFRTMKKDTPNIATHLLYEPEKYYLRGANILRKLSLDELPNLLNIMKGQMVFIGPRPALYNQYDLIEARTKKGIDKMLPGITGWAQINGRDEIPIEEKVKLDEYYLINQSLSLDIKILFQTIWYAAIGKNVSH